MQSISIVVCRLAVSVCLLLFVLTEGHTILKHMVDKLDPNLAESVGVELSAESKRHSRYRRDGISSDQSDELNFDLRIADQPIHLVLRHNPNADTELPIYVMRSGKAVQEDVPSLRVTRMYQDSAHEGSFAVTEPMGDSSGYMLEGIFTVNNDLYLISPNTDGGRMKRSKSGYSHNVHKLESTVNIFPDSVLSDEEDVVARATSGRRKRGSTDYDVELYMVTDSTIYDFWYDKQTEKRSTEKRLLTLDAIRQYYAFIINGVDLRYKNIKGEDFSITILARGLLITQLPKESPWTVSIAVAQSRGRAIVDAEKAKESFTQWVKGQDDISQADHVMLFTGYDIASDGVKATTGLAALGGICGLHKTSIVENKNFDFRVVITAAHELGHSLGAEHDGYENECSTGDQYIMAGMTSDILPKNGNNRWNFSPCSLTYFKGTLESLNQKGNCLSEKSQKSNRTESSLFIIKKPGQVYSLDQQCAYSLGDGSSFCRFNRNKETTYSLLCVGMRCSIPGGRTCMKIIPAEGSSCGNKQWCINGRCVEDEKAPALQPLCPFGDTPGIPVGMDMTCQEMIKRSPYDCNKDKNFQMCCDSCSSIRSNNPGCEYGDGKGCETYATRLNCAENEAIASGCCATCKSYDTGIAGCKHGDLFPQCKKFKGYKCYKTSISVDCCETCHSFKTGLEGCEYGDRKPYCEGVQCKLGNNAKDCCETCK